MKLIIRADDMGMSEAVNYGCYHAITHGIVTTVGVMPNMKYTEQAFQLLKSTPHVDVGIHTHLLGTPCANPKQIPSLVQEDGTFKVRKNRKLVQDTKMEVNEIIVELEAEYHAFLYYRKQKPAYFEVAAFEPEICEALAIVARRHDIPFNVIKQANFKIGGLTVPPCEPEYDHMNLITAPPAMVENYEEMLAYYLRDEGHVLTHDHVMMAFHPGYIDAYVLANSTLIAQRAYDVQLLCSEEMKHWIKEHNIEIVTLSKLIKDNT